MALESSEISRPLPSAEADVWTWIMLAILLVTSALIAVGSLALLDSHQEAQAAIPTVPGRPAPAAPAPK